jgi:TetR/AcrR family transcriptional regulator, tetracycline repressor protein
MRTPAKRADSVTKRRGRPPTITRADVVSAALRLGREVGLDRFTIAQLAAELGVAPMTPYHYVTSRSVLVQLVVEELLGRIEIPGPETGPWDVRLKVLEANARRELGGIPGVPTGISPEASDASQRLAEGVFAILADAGFDEETALLAYGALFTYMIGQLDLDVAANRGAGTNEASRFAALMDRTVDRRPTSDDIFDFGFGLLLAGLHEVLRDG